MRLFTLQFSCREDVYVSGTAGVSMMVVDVFADSEAEAIQLAHAMQREPSHWDIDDITAEEGEPMMRKMEVG